MTRPQSPQPRPCEFCSDPATKTISIDHDGEPAPICDRCDAERTAEAQG